MSDNDGQPRRDRLDELVSVVRAQTPPDLPLDRLQRKLAVEFEVARARGGLGLRVASGGRMRRSLSWIAVAATLLLGIGVARQWARISAGSARDSARVADVSVAGSSIDGTRLEPGVEVAAEPDQGLRVEHAGRGTWELEPGSRAHLIEVESGVLCVELTHGTLTAAVVPSDRPESFIVRAKGTEVAVHGTRFRVRLDADRVHVDVTEGEVEVRPMQRTTHVLLTRGMNAGFVGGVLQPGSFEASGLPPARVVEPGRALPEPVAAGTGSERAAPSDRQAAPGAPQSAASPDPLSRIGGSRAPQSAPLRGRSLSASGAVIEAVTPPAPLVSPGVAPASPADSESTPSADVSAAVADAAIARVTEHIESCFRRHTPGRGPVSIEASTRVALEVQPSGVILGVSLEPPLAPQVEHCVASELATVNLGESESGYRVRREIRLSL